MHPSRFQVLLLLVTIFASSEVGLAQNSDYAQKAEELLREYKISSTNPRNSSKTPNIFTTNPENDMLINAPGDHIARHALQELESQYGVRISQSFLGNYIIARNDPKNKIYGFDIWAALNHPQIMPWFRSKSNEPREEDRDYEEKEGFELLETALKIGNPRKGTQYQIGYSYAIPQFGLVFIQERGLTKYVYEASSQRLRSDATELMFHEAMHVLHKNEIPKEVEKFLSIPEGFYAREKAVRQACPQLLERFGVRPGFTQEDKDFCGFSKISEAMQFYAKKYKIPQLHGKDVGLEEFDDEKNCGEEAEYNKHLRVVIGGKNLCRHVSDPDNIEDIHAFHERSEYFAILMETYIFNRKEFDRVANPQERKFIEWVFGKYLAPKSAGCCDDAK